MLDNRTQYNYVKFIYLLYAIPKTVLKNTSYLAFPEKIKQKKTWSFRGLCT